MKILFVSPDDIIKSDVKKFFSWINHKFVFGFGKSLAFPILTALTPKEHEIELIEGDFDDINFDNGYDLVGITTVTRYAPLAYQIADEFRKRGAKVVLGGWHASVLSEEAKIYADSVVIGEAEEAWPIIIKDFENNNLKSFYNPTEPFPAEKFPNPSIEIFPKRARSSVQATRGCPYKCEFCAINSFKFRDIFRMRPIDNVIKDIKSVPNRGFFFLDSSLTINTDYTKALFKEMKKLNTRFYAYGNINVLAKDEELLKLSNEAGCYSWFVGLESVSQKSLENIRKKTNLVDDYISAIRKIHDHGITVMGSFMFGFDEDTPEIFDDTVEAIDDWGIDLAEFHIVTPYPGTELHDRLKKEDRLLHKDWSKYNTANVVFQPKNMTPEELFNGTKSVAKRFYTYPKVIKRSHKALETTKSPYYAYYVLQRSIQYRERYKNQFNF